MAVSVGIVSAVVGVYSAVSQARAAKKAAKADKQAAAAANKQASLQRQREIRQKIAASRVRQAEITSAGFAAGAPGASSVAGAQGGLQSDTASAIGFSNQIFGLEQQRIGFLNQAQASRNSANTTAAYAGAITQIGGLFA